MRKLFIIPVICAAVCLTVFETKAEVAGGVIFGNPSGFSLRIDNTVVLGLGGWGWGMVLFGDHWIIHKPIPTNSSLELNWYLGLGGEMMFVNSGYWDHGRYYYYYGNYSGGFLLGVRVPIGLEIPFEQRWEAFFEVAPVLGLFPFGTGGNGGIGIRYQF